MSAGMLPKFHVRNLRTSNRPAENQNSLVRISALAYDTTISDHPGATLRYRDEEGDKIMLGSSHELIDKLEEPITQPSVSSSRRKKDRMSIAMLLSEVQQNPDAVYYHTFDIEEREEIQKLWQEIQQRNKTPPPPSTSPGVEQPSSEHLAKVVLPSIISNNDPSMKKIANGSGGRNFSIGGQQTQTYVGSNMQKNEDRRNKLSVVYNRFKPEIWAPIAAELGISWEQAEALHWVLGKDEMIRRAEELNPSQTDSFEDPVSVKSTDWNRHEDGNKKIRPSTNSSSVQKSEDYRKHHFDATMPPELQIGIPASQVVPKFAVGKAPYTGVAKSTLTKGSFPSLAAAPVANLTTDGKRQAQAAGDILRSRTTPSRHRKVVTTTTDHTNHQNRWASYKSPNTAFSPKTSTTPSQGFSVPTLTPEGRRQAQAAGDKLRSRTNPIRHSRPSRSGSLEHGISKNRWASYVAPRVARFEERHHATADLKDDLQSKESGIVEQEKQPSLLEVFEAELAKNFLNSDEVTGEGKAPDPEVIDITSPNHESSSLSPDSNQSSTAIQIASPPRQSRAVPHGIDLINDYVQRLTLAGGAQEFSNVVDQGVRAATGAIEALARRVPGRLHDAVGQIEQLGAVQHEAEIMSVNDAVDGLREFVSNIATGLSWPGGSVQSHSPGANEKKDKDDESPTTAVDAVPTEDSSENAIEALDYISSAFSHPLSSTSEKHIPPSADAGAKMVANACNSRQAPSPQFISEINSAQQTQTNGSPSTHRKRTINALRYHKPGPIHLPQATTSRPDIGTPSGGFRNSDHLRQSRSIVSVDKPATSPPPAATRFPTLAQFEVQNFAAAPPFPALPSMEPMIPQQVAPQNVINMFNMETWEQSYATNILPESSQQQNPNTILDTKQRLVDKGIDPSGLPDSQLSNFTMQNPWVQTKQIQRYAQHLAESQRQRKHPQDSQMEPILNEGQNRDCLLKTRQEPMASDTASPDHQDGSRPTVQVPTTSQSNPPKNHALQDYQMQLMLLEQQNKNRLRMAREESNEYQSDTASPSQQDGSRPPGQIPIVTQPNTPKNHALQDYQMQLMLLEQQNKNRLLMAREASNEYLKDQDNTNSIAKQQLEVEQRNEERPALALRDHGASHTSSPLPRRLPHTQALEDRCNKGAASETFGKSEEHDDQASFNFPALTSAARLAEPFDPLDVEASAQPQLSQAISRNATVAGTDSRHNARRRRPYSEAFDGFGRVAWESFEGVTEHEDRDSPHVPGMNLTRQREPAIRNRERHQRREESLDGGPTLHESRLISPVRGYDDEHQDDTTMEKVESCVSQLRDLGFGSEEDGSGDRLLVYAQAAGGDLVDAMDMIDEEQEAYRGL